MDDGKQRIAGLFNRASSTYDRAGPQFFSRLGECLVDQAQLQPGDRVLDVATGRGAHLIPAAAAVGRGGYVIGIDLAEGMVQATAEEMRSLHLENVEVRQMDAEQLQFEAESFDCVLCGFAIFFFPHLDQAMAEMHRVLKPGGRIVISTWEKSLEAQWQWYDQLVNSFFPPENPAEEQGEDEGSPVFDTPEGVSAILAKAGFTGITVSKISTEAVYHSKDEFWSNQWSHGGRSTLERIEAKLGKDGLERFRQAVYEELDRRMQADGFHVQWPALCAMGIKTAASSPGLVN